MENCERSSGWSRTEWSLICDNKRVPALTRNSSLFWVLNSSSVLTLKMLPLDTNTELAGNCDSKSRKEPKLVSFKLIAGVCPGDKDL
ncbi:hypothetical protein OGAPHI_001513 [Ogataea philodendri]|uniref:Uncharacterized protein n=1 Tax=Ogataea philodendri TaxID=1378263 RepID=A0A9P8PCC8_9ASCO|nr:uncharacterized protein OGAPHI_001513 [Ogataea philodendri]KAH3669392.1 hypothetical protein OGAPHI_001513 [Ogataea philodendri]